MNINNMNNYNNLNDNEIEVNIVEKIANGYHFDNKWKINAINYLKSERLTKRYSEGYILPGGFLPRDVFGNVITPRPLRSPSRQPRSPPRQPRSPPESELNKIDKYYIICEQLYNKCIRYYMYIGIVILGIIIILGNKSI